MKYRCYPLLILGVLFLISFTFSTPPAITGAWERVDDSGNKTVAMIGNSHYMISMYKEDPAEFLATMGGLYTWEGDKFMAEVEFHTQDSTLIGQHVAWELSVEGQTLRARHVQSGEVQEFTRVDQGSETDLVGAWRISGRMRNGEMSEMKWGARKTIKMCTGTRFQWVAFNPETKSFGGTGGGTYTLENGTYTEHIEFFSRDNTRVGASLEFDAKVTGKEWDHSGLSSKGSPIREIWQNVD